ncbi:hypothetical protein EJB05_01518, partial [Eragrostis curvula]
MNLFSTTLAESARSFRLLKVDGCPPYNHNLEYLEDNNNQYNAYRWEVDGYEWEIRFYPKQYHVVHGSPTYMALELIFLSMARGNKVTANLSGRLIDPTGTLQPTDEKVSPSNSFRRPSDSSGKFQLMDRHGARSDGYLTSNGTVTVECTVVVFKDPEDNPVPSSNLQKDLGELLRCGCGADVTFIVSGESLAAHKNVLAVRSPVFMAEFFGEMKEKTSRCIEIKEIEAAVFKAMLGFIYTDTVPELDDNRGIAISMAQHLLVAADRYGLERLKVMCERRLVLGIDAGTVAAMLALAEQHGSSQLKAKCIEFIVEASPEIVGAIFATGGFKSLEASLLTDLFMAAHGRIKK